MELLAGVLKSSSARCVMVSCGAPDCEENHPTYPVGDVVIIPEGIPRGRMEDHELFEQMVADKKLAVSSTTIYPTLLGIWWEAINDN